MLFGFGQPMNGIVQLGFVVRDLEAAMDEFGTRLRIGPWTVFRNFAGDDPRYHGAPTQATAHVALGFCGHLQYELIEPADDLPSVHRDLIVDTGYGFHHFGRATTTFDADVAALNAQGYATAFSASVGPGSRVAYFDTRDVLPGMTELLESGPGLDSAFTPMYLAAAAASVP